MNTNWTPNPTDRVVHHPRENEVDPVRVTVTGRRVPFKFAASPLLMFYIFAGLIAFGALLLLLPFTQNDNGFTPFVTALFTSASAITVTGLVVENTATYWTRSGQVIILGMIYIGGLGYMTLVTFLLILIGQRIPLAQQLLVRESLLINQIGGMLRLTIAIIVMATAIQFLGFLALFARFYFLYPIPEAIWQAAFLAVSGFNGAGFEVISGGGNLQGFAHDTAIMSIIAALILIGTLSYLVLIDLFTIRRFSRFTLNTKLVLIATLVMTLVSIIGFFGLEYQNPQTLGQLTVHEKAIASTFQGISGRTAGFSITDFGETGDHTNLLTVLFMFIGGASASVAGGIKVNTFAIIVAAVISTVRGRSNTTAFGREIPVQVVQRAVVVGAVFTAFVFLMVLLLSVSESGVVLLDLFFEAVSAFGTVGLSTGITKELSNIGLIILVATMFIGKLGPIALGITMAQQSEIDLYRYPRERVTIG